ncbi:hypothetical protein Ae706Ps2_6700 [Pseudonocardia sp. Ae706_Ps2]|nr:hypothetical protein Ae706Ps2_6700 [Pseudonocardia sp. Ae706_Ps2]
MPATISNDERPATVSASHDRDAPASISSTEPACNRPRDRYSATAAVSPARTCSDAAFSHSWANRCTVCNSTTDDAVPTRWENNPPAPTAPNCSGSPVNTTFAPASAARLVIRCRSTVEVIPASSTTTRSPAPSRSRT